MDLHDFMRSMRENRGLTVRELAAESGVGKSVIGHVEQGIMVRAGTLKKLLSGLGLTEKSREWGRAIALWMEAKFDWTEAGIREQVMTKVSGLSREQLLELLAWVEKRGKKSR